jgi:hypothetical protein
LSERHEGFTVVFVLASVGKFPLRKVSMADKKVVEVFNAADATAPSEADTLMLNTKC